MAPSVIAYLSIGSNVGDRLANLRHACLQLERAGVHLHSWSSVYETEPVDVLEQEWFLNCAAAVETALQPLDLLDKVHLIERDLGRIREKPKGPRTVDIDILLYGDCTFHSETLVLPHPRMMERRFVLEPLQEIAPTLRIPPESKTVAELFCELKDPAQVRRDGPLDWQVTAESEHGRI